MTSEESTCSDGPRSAISENLIWVVGPESEDESDFVKAMQVCECVAAKAELMWDWEKYQEFSNSLSLYASQLKLLAPSEKPLNAEYPRIPSSLQDDLAELIPLVEACESQVGTRLEF